MPIQATYTSARANLSKLCEEVTGNRKVVIINRRGYEDGGAHCRLGIGQSR